MIGQNPKAKVALFSSAEIGIKNMSLEERCRREQMVRILCETPGEETEPGFAGQ